MPRRPKYDPEIEIKLNPIDDERNPLEIHETWIKLEPENSSPVKLEVIKNEQPESSARIKNEPDSDSASTNSYSDARSVNHSAPTSPQSYSAPPSPDARSVKSVSPINIPNPQRKVITLRWIECRVCGKEILKTSMNRHIKNLHPDEAALDYGCNFCDKKFNAKRNLMIHMTVMHPNEAKVVEPEQLICDYDGKVFKTRNDLQGHMQVHVTSKLERVRCEVCHREVQQRYLNRHMSEVHTDKKYQCDICNLCVKSSRGLLVHKKGHNREHECKICKKSFALSSKLKVHIRTVHERPKECTVCDICGKEFRFKGHLDTHRKSHVEKKRNFKCDKCPWAFFINSNLKRHQKCHEKEEARAALIVNPEKCQICSKYFTKKKNYVAHMKSVHQKIQEKSVEGTETNIKKKSSKKVKTEVL